MDFGLFPGARGTERNGRKRENQAQNLSGSAEGEVRKFPHEPSRTRGNTRDRPRKNPNSDELGFCIWWRVRTRVQFLQVGSMLTPVVALLTVAERCLHLPPLLENRNFSHPSDPVLWIDSRSYFDLFLRFSIMPNRHSDGMVASSDRPT